MPCSRFRNETGIVEHFGAIVEPRSACFAGSATPLPSCLRYRRDDHRYRDVALTLLNSR
jgi:hypothetical protein